VLWKRSSASEPNEAEEIAGEAVIRAARKTDVVILMRLPFYGSISKEKLFHEI
jgi:hypothetical protein